MIVESSSSLHLTVSQDEDEQAPGLSKLSSSCSASSDDESGVESAASEPQSQSKEMPVSNKTGLEEPMGALTVDEPSSKIESEDAKTAETTDESSDETVDDPSKTEEQQPLEILNSEQQGDGSLYIEVKDDGCGDPEENAGDKVKRLARKAGIIVGGGTMTAVGTVMLFLPCPTPSIYLMIGGMAIMSKEVPAAQRQLDITRGNLEVWVDRAEKQFAQGGRKINVTVDNGTPKAGGSEGFKEEVVKEESNGDQTPGSITSTHVVHLPRQPVKRHVVKSCRNVILPLLNKVCTPQEGETNEEGAAEEANPQEVNAESNNENTVEDKENAKPAWGSTFARWSSYRETRRLELLNAEEQREREAMLARINEANLKKVKEDSESNEEENVVQEVASTDEEEEEEEEEEELPPPALMEVVQGNSSAVIRV